MLDAATHKAFDLLGLAPTSDVTKIRKTWRKLARKHHPDQVGGCKVAANQRLADINAAFDLVWVWSQQTPRTVETSRRDAQAAARAKAEASAHAKAKAAARARAEATARAAAAARAKAEATARAKAEAAARAKAKAADRKRAEVLSRKRAQKKSTQTTKASYRSDSGVTAAARVGFLSALSALEPMTARRTFGFA